MWTAMAVTLIVYVGYPVAMVTRSAWRPPRKRESSGGVPDDVTMVISAYNEASVIRKKLENCESLSFPRDRIEFIVISDASDDETDAIVTEWTARDRRFRLVRMNRRLGKSVGLVEVVPSLQCGLVVFSDANSIYHEDAISRLIEPLRDPGVGYTVGQQRYVKGRQVASWLESVYWRIESRIKVGESLFGGVVGGDGAIMAIRRDLFTPLRPDDISDFVLPLRIVVSGFRGVYVAEAICEESAARSINGEFRRKRRIVARSLGAVLRTPSALIPSRTGWFAVRLLLHKVLRWMVPFFLVLILVSSIALVADGNQISRYLLAVQVAGVGLGALYAIPFLRRFAPVGLAWYFLVANAAAAVGVANCLMGKSTSTWETERSECMPSGRASPCAPD
ncbi:MAG: glycosyltransferase family 2 protein [Planctomycetes bacterium]|nr:glycosyltransferase family 2 protein [Planctomycetota bacterium]